MSMSIVTAVDGKVRLDRGDGSYTDYLTKDAIQLGGYLIREAYNAAGVPLPDTVTLRFDD